MTEARGLRDDRDVRSARLHSSCGHVSVVCFSRSGHLSDKNRDKSCVAKYLEHIAKYP
jgi:hypothetical protein